MGEEIQMLYIDSTTTLFEDAIKLAQGTNIVCVC